MAPSEASEYAASAGGAGSSPSSLSATAGQPLTNFIDKALLLAESGAAESLRGDVDRLRASLATAQQREAAMRERLERVEAERAVEAARHAELLEAQAADSERLEGLLRAQLAKGGGGGGGGGGGEAEGPSGEGEDVTVVLETRLNAAQAEESKLWERLGGAQPPQPQQGSPLAAAPAAMAVATPEGSP